MLPRLGALRLLGNGGIVLGEVLLKLRGTLLQLDQEHYLHLTLDNIRKLKGLKTAQHPTHPTRRHTPISYRSQALAESLGKAGRTEEQCEKASLGLGLVAYLEANLGPLTTEELYTAAKSLRDLVSPLRASAAHLLSALRNLGLNSDAHLLPKASLQSVRRAPTPPATLLDLYEYGLAGPGMGLPLKAKGLKPAPPLLTRGLLTPTTPRAAQANPGGTPVGTGFGTAHRQAISALQAVAEWGSQAVPQNHNRPLLSGLGHTLHAMGSKGVTFVAIVEYVLSEASALCAQVFTVRPTFPRHYSYGSSFVEKAQFVQTKTAALFEDIALAHYRVGLTYSDYLTATPVDRYEEARSFRGLRSLLEARRAQPLFYTTRVFELISGLLPDIGLLGIIEEVFTNSVGAEGGLWSTEDVDSLVDLAVLDDAFETAFML